MKTITINSDNDYFVYGTSYSQAVKDEHTNTVNNSSTWTGTRVLIHKGIATYPAEIAEWKSVKALQNAMRLTISPSVNGTITDAEDTEAVETVKKAEALRKKDKIAQEQAEAKKKAQDDLYLKALSELANKKTTE